MVAAVQYSAVPHDSTAFQVKWNDLKARASGFTVHRKLPSMSGTLWKPPKNAKLLQNKALVG
jgi:hypothetical protein